VAGLGGLELIAQVRQVLGQHSLAGVLVVGVVHAADPREHSQPGYCA